MACVKRLAMSQRRDADMLGGFVGAPLRPNLEIDPSSDVPLRVAAAPVVEAEQLEDVVKPIVTDVTRKQVWCTCGIWLHRRLPKLRGSACKEPSGYPLRRVP